MNLDAFVSCQLWAAVDDGMSADYDALIAAGKDTNAIKALVPLVSGDGTLVGGFHVGEQAFCVFAPQDGDQTQFQCLLYLYRTRDAKDQQIFALYMRVREKMYWIDHRWIRQITKPIEDLDLSSPSGKRARTSRMPSSTPPTNDPAMIPFVVLDFGVVRLRLWIDRPGLSTSMQAKRLLQATRLMEFYLPSEAVNPMALDAPIVSPGPLQLLDKLNKLLSSKPCSAEDVNEQVHRFCALGEKHGINFTSKTPIELSTLCDFAASLLLNDWGVDVILHLTTLDSIPCSEHDECFFPDKNSNCSSTLWHHWDQALATENETVKASQDTSTLNQLADNITKAAVTDKVKKQWTSHTDHSLCILKGCESRVVDKWYPLQVRATKPTDVEILTTKNHLETIRELQKKCWDTELSVLLL